MKTIAPGIKLFRPPPQFTVTCSGCDAAARTMSRCAACKGVPYCSRECQVKCWPSHKKICKENKEGWRLMREFGRHLEDDVDYMNAVELVLDPSHPNTNLNMFLFFTASEFERFIEDAGKGKRAPVGSVLRVPGASPSGDGFLYSFAISNERLDKDEWPHLDVRIPYPVLRVSLQQENNNR